MIQSLRLQQYRSYTDDSFELEPGVNIIVGPNASGKTNILEAVLLLARGSSYRARDIELIMHDQPWARLEAVTDKERRVIKLEQQELSRIQKTFVVQDQKYARLSHQRSWPVILFEPNHLQLLNGPPELRREYLDQLLEQLYAGFGPLRRQYKRTLSQRNALLKSDTSDDNQLFAWNIRLSTLGGRIAEQRLGLVKYINEKLPAIYSQLAHHESSVEVIYISSCLTDNYSSQLLKKLEKGIAIDRLRGFTAHGPHRDDWRLELNGRPAEQSASRGETRTLLLSLKILELELIEEARGQKPLLLLDDVFSELDGARRRALTDILQTHQTFITTTDADVVVRHFMERSHIIPLG